MLGLRCIGIEQREVRDRRSAHPVGLPTISWLALHVPASRINDIVLERRGITADTALRAISVAKKPTPRVGSIGGLPTISRRHLQNMQKPLREKLSLVKPIGL